ncbi:hypothetical protein GW755_01945 [bacterium]|nr:hypothetical protein [bacterium]
MRSCPKCHAQINNPLSFFCFDCGSRLLIKEKEVSFDSNKIEEVVSADSSSIVNKVSHFDDKKTKKWNSFVLGANALSLMFVLFSAGVFFRTNFIKNTNTIDPLVSVNSVELEVKNLGIKLEEEVLKSDFYAVVPGGVIFYAESSDPGYLMGSLLTSQQKKYIADSYELKFSDFLIFMRSDYAFVKKNKSSWAIITKTGGVDFFERTYAKYQKNKSKDARILTSRIGEFLVVSNDLNLVQEMEDVNNKISLGLQNNANFSRSIGSVKDYVVFFAYSPSKDFLADDLEVDLKLFGLDSLLEDLGKVEGSGLYVVKDSTGYSVKQLN